MQGRTRRWLLESGVAALVLVAAVLVSVRASAETKFFVDEGFYMGSSQYFYYLFVQHDVTRREWGNTYNTHTQPMFTRYLLGASLWLSGVTFRDLPPAYHFGNAARFYKERGPLFWWMLARARAPFL